MKRQYIYFNELPTRALFSLNGSSYIKQSTRTAYLPETNRWFYMGMLDLCVVATGDAGSYCRLTTDYFEV